MSLISIKRRPGRYAAASTSSNESRALERRALLELVALRKAILAAVSAAVKKNNFKVSRVAPLLKRFHAALADVSTASYFLGQNRARKEISKFAPDLKLSLLTDTLATLRSVSKADVEKIRAQYDDSTAYVIRTLTTDLETSVRDSIAKSIAEGLHIQPSIDRALSAASGAFNAQTIVRTQVQLAYQAAKYLEYQEPFVNEAIWGYEYITVGDDRVRDDHAAMDGMRLPKDDPRWASMWPPNGYQCRCSVLPIFTDDDASLKSPKEPDPEGKPDPGWGFTPNQVTAIPYVPSTPVTPVDADTEARRLKAEAEDKAKAAEDAKIAKAKEQAEEAAAKAQADELAKADAKIKEDAAKVDAKAEEARIEAAYKESLRKREAEDAAEEARLKAEKDAKAAEAPKVEAPKVEAPKPAIEPKVNELITDEVKQKAIKYVESASEDGMINMGKHFSNGYVDQLEAYQSSGNDWASKGVRVLINVKSQMYATQEFVESDRVVWFIQNGVNASATNDDDDQIRMVIRKGRLYVHDGHHRAFAEKTINRFAPGQLLNALVIDEDGKGFDKFTAR